MGWISLENMFRNMKLTVHIDDDLHEKIRTIAFKEKTTISDLVRIALEDHYSKSKDAQNLEKLWGKPKK